MGGDSHHPASPRRLAGAASLGTILALDATPARAASPGWDALDPFGLDGPDVVTLYAALLILAAMLTWLLRDMASTTDRRPDLRNLGEIELAYCVGGDERAADTLYIALASRGAAHLEGSSIVVDGTVAGLPSQVEALSRALVGSHSRERFVSIFIGSSSREALLDGLLARKILLAPARRTRLAVANWLPLILLLALGLAEVGVGLWRGQPVALLPPVMALSGLLFAALFGGERYLTREARASLDALRDRRNRTLKGSAAGRAGLRLRDARHHRARGHSPRRLRQADEAADRPRGESRRSRRMKHAFPNFRRRDSSRSTFS